MVTVANLRNMLQRILDELSYYDDDEEVYCRPNTYNIGSSYIATYDGFIDPYDIRICEDEDEEVTE